MNFGKFFRRFHFRSIRNKYFFSIIAISIPALSLLGLISFTIAKNTIIQNQLTTTRDHLKTSSEVADLLFRNIINVERLISWNQELSEELKASNRETAMDETIGEKTRKRLQHLLSNYLIDTKNIDSICIFDANFRSVCYGNAKSFGDYDRGGNDYKVVLTDWYQETVAAKGRPVFFNYNVLVKEQSNNTFSSVKLLKDPQSLFHSVQIGLLVVNVKKSMFTQVFPEREYNSFFILDSTNGEVNVVYSDTIAPEKIKIKKDISSTLQSLQQDGYIFSHYQNQTTGWTFVNAVKEEELLEQSNKIGVYTLLIASVISVITLISSYILSNRVTKPFKMIIDWTKRLRNAEENQNEDEIQAIGKTFERMTNENKELSEELIRAKLKEKEAELRALQTQIKPHFLYNTLDSIYWMAVLENQHNIANMAVSLSETFKLTLNNGQEFIQVSKELEHIKHYLTIQNIRFHNRFQYIQDVELSLMDRKILKLLLQPLIENAIYHGLEPKEGNGTIWLTGRMEKDWMIFIVQDNGIGIEDMEKIHEGYGLRNVRERLLLYYGDSSSLTVQSKMGQGTRIEIRIPLER